MVPGSIPGRPTMKTSRPTRDVFFLLYCPGMPFSFAWEQPAAFIGAAAVMAAAAAAVSGVVEEAVADHVLQYGDCAAYVARTGHGEDDGAYCRLRVFASYGRYVSETPPPAAAESPCDVIAEPEIRTWTFVAGSLRDRC